MSERLKVGDLGHLRVVGETLQTSPMHSFTKREIYVAWAEGAPPGAEINGYTGREIVVTEKIVKAIKVFDVRDPRNPTDTTPTVEKAWKGLQEESYPTK